MNNKEIHVWIDCLSVMQTNILLSAGLEIQDAPKTNKVQAFNKNIDIITNKIQETKMWLGNLEVFNLEG